MEAIMKENYILAESSQDLLERKKQKTKKTEVFLNQHSFNLWKLNYLV